MDLSSYIFLIVKESFRQKPVTLAMPELEFKFKNKLRLYPDNQSSSSDDFCPGYDSDECISRDQIFPKKSLDVNELLYTRKITKLIGHTYRPEDMQWTVENKDGIQVKDLLELVFRIKPRKKMINMLCPWRSISLSHGRDSITLLFHC